MAIQLPLKIRKDYGTSPPGVGDVSIGELVVNATTGKLYTKTLNSSGVPGIIEITGGETSSVRWVDVQEKPEFIAAGGTKLLARAAIDAASSSDIAALENSLSALSLSTSNSLTNKVDKQSGYGLSQNNFSTLEKDKLAGIQAGAVALSSVENVATSVRIITSTDSNKFFRKVQGAAQCDFMFTGDFIGNEQFIISNNSQDQTARVLDGSISSTSLISSFDLGVGEVALVKVISPDQYDLVRISSNVSNEDLEFIGAMASIAQANFLSGFADAFPTVVDGILASSTELPVINPADIVSLRKVFIIENTACGVAMQFSGDSQAPIEYFWNESAIAKSEQVVFCLADGLSYRWDGASWVEYVFTLPMAQITDNAGKVLNNRIRLTSIAQLNTVAIVAGGYDYVGLDAAGNPSEFLLDVFTDGARVIQIFSGAPRGVTASRIYNGTSWGAVKFSAARVEVQTVTSASKTFTTLDQEQYFRYTAAGAKTATFDSSAGFAAGDEFHIANRAASGNITISGAGVTFNAPKGGTLVLEPGDTVTVKFISPTEADVMGSTGAA